MFCRHSLKHSTLAVVVYLAVVTPNTAFAVFVNVPVTGIVGIEFTGLFTMTNPSGGVSINDDSSDNEYSGARTNISGVGWFDLATSQGAASITDFQLFGNGLASDLNIYFSHLSTIDNNPLNDAYYFGQMAFDWDAHDDIPVSMVMDSVGFFANLVNALNALDTGAGSTVIDSALCAVENNCAISATEDTPFFLGGHSVGGAPFAMTTNNTGLSISDAYPLIDDGVAGSPMTTSPFLGANLDIDFTCVDVTSYHTTTGLIEKAPGLPSCDESVSTIPIPAAVWLFGSGLLGLIALAKRKTCDIKGAAPVLIGELLGDTSKNA